MHLRTGFFIKLNPSYNPYPSVVHALPRRTTLICKIRTAVLRVTQVLAQIRETENTLT